MAGTLQVNECAAWTPAGWIFNNVLERVAARLEGDDFELSNTVIEALGPTPGHLDLSLEGAGRLQLFAQAAEGVCRRMEETGAAAFPEASFYEPYMQELRRLLQLLHADPRYGAV